MECTIIFTATAVVYQLAVSFCRRCNWTLPIAPALFLLKDLWLLWSYSYQRKWLGRFLGDFRLEISAILPPCKVKKRVNLFWITVSCHVRFWDSEKSVPLLKLHNNISAFALAYDLLFPHLVILPHKVHLGTTFLCESFPASASCLLCAPVAFFSIQFPLFTLWSLFRQEEIASDNGRSTWAVGNDPWIKCNTKVQKNAPSEVNVTRKLWNLFLFSAPGCFLCFS